MGESSDTAIAWARVSATLERAIRESLAPRIGRGPRTSRIAHLLAQATLLESASDNVRAAALPIESSLEAFSAQVRGFASEMVSEAERLRDQASRLEGEQIGAPDAARYAELCRAASSIQALDRVRDLANEMIQALGRLGPGGLASLHAVLREACARAGFELPEDVEARLAAEVGRAREAAEEAMPSAPGPLVGMRPNQLLKAAEEVETDAPKLDGAEIFDRIESVAGRLKSLQENPPAPLDESDARIVKMAFGILTRVSRDHRPGWTPLLDNQRSGEDWLAYASDADERQARRLEARKDAKRRARREQIRRAVERAREEERRQLRHDTIELLKRDLYLLDKVWHVPGAEDFEAEKRRRARTDAAIALRTCASDEEVEEIALLLEERKELVAEGRAFRRLRRVWGIEEVSPEHDEVDDETDQDLDEGLVEDAVAEIEALYTSEVYEAEGAGEGERILLVGGIPREPIRKRLSEFFGWVLTDWRESYRDRQADFRTLRKRIAEGRFDRVIVLARFCGHDVSFSLRDACRTHGVSYHVHPRGASVPAIAASVYGI